MHHNDEKPELSQARAFCILKTSPYLFPFLESREGTKEAYREYQLALRSFNQQLMLLGELLGLGDKLSSYTAKHNQFSI